MSNRFQPEIIQNQSRPWLSNDALNATFYLPARPYRAHWRRGTSIYTPQPPNSRDAGPAATRLPNERRRRMFDCSGRCHAAVQRRSSEEVPPELTLRSIVPGGVSVGSPVSRAMLACA